MLHQYKTFVGRHSQAEGSLAARLPAQCPSSDPALLLQGDGQLCDLTDVEPESEDGALS